jgi:metal-responsive CopG/Arc/MetJ family transcriptional regulator
MIYKTKKSVSLSNSLVREMALYDSGKNTSAFIEDALNYYLTELKKQERRQRDTEILNANAKRFKREAEENLKYQTIL